jgi:hypothetical protein
MKVGEIAKNIKADIKVVGDLEKEVTGCYVSDLLSDVLANSKEGELWITHQSHPNVVAVASVRGLSGVIISGDRDIEPETTKKAEAEQVNLITSSSSTFEIVGAVYNLLK